MTPPTQPAALAATAAAVALLVVQAGLGLYLGLPGQLSFDSVIQLYEGRTLHFISFNPPLMSVLLGLLDRLGDAPAAFVLMSQAMLSGATALVVFPATRTPAWRFGFAAPIVLNPVVLCYVGILWKDVLLAHSVVLTYFLMAWLRRQERPLTPTLAVFVLALLTIVVGARQQGILFALPAAVWGATLVRGSRRVRLLAGVALLAIPIAASSTLDAYAARARAPGLDPVGAGLRVLVLFDIVGVLANGGEVPQSTPPGIAAELHEQAGHYSPYRVDTLYLGMPAYSTLDNSAARSLWRATIRDNPGAYWRHRTAYFATVLGLADMHQCLPLYAGIASPVLHPSVDGDVTALLGISVRETASMDWAQRFGMENANTPLFMHLAYGLVLVTIGLWLCRRRDYVLATLAAATLIFLMSYAVVGIACDFRYVYLLTVATTLLAAYFCLNAGMAGGASGEVPRSADR